MANEPIQAIANDLLSAFQTGTLPAALALSSYASSAGFALGELLLLTGKSNELSEYLREIHITAQATIISAEAGSEPVMILRQGVTLSDAALRAVRAWSADPQDPADLDDAMALLSEVLVEMGVLQGVAREE